MEIIGTIWTILIYNPMMNAMLFIYSFIPNYGVAIILFTIIVGTATMPFRIKSQQSMKKQQEKMAALKPRLDELKKKYKDNPQEYQKQQMKVYQENGAVNPFNAGCLLTLLPFPIFIAMYQVITAVMGDRPEQMMQLPLHIYQNFIQAGSLIPVNSNFLGLNLSLSPSAQGLFVTVVMVGLVVGSSFIQTRMMSSSTASLDPSQAQMNKSMQYMTPLIFGFFVLNAPTGLSLYWITFSVIGIIQQGLTGGWDGLTNILPRAAPPPPVRTKKVADSSSSSAPQLNPPNGNQNQVPASTRSDGASATKGKKKSGKKR